MIPGWVAKIPHASWSKKKTQNITQQLYCNKFHRDFKNHPHKKIKKKKDSRLPMQEAWVQVLVGEVLPEL